MKRLILILGLLTAPAFGQYTIGQWTAATAGTGGSTASTPTFSPPSGAVSNPTTVTASTTTTGCTMYLDASNPPTTAQSTYSVTTGVTLYAQAKSCSGHGNSAVASAAYTISGGYTDNFPGSSLSGNWTCYSGTGYAGPIVGSAQVQNNHPSLATLCGYTGTFSSSLSQAKAGALMSSVYQAAQGLCVNLNVSTGNGYCTGMSGSQGIQKITAGVEAAIGSYCGGNSVAVGDVVKLQNVGGTITETDITQSWSCSATDSTYTGGVSGFSFGNAGAGYTVNAWSTWSGS